MNATFKMTLAALLLTVSGGIALAQLPPAVPIEGSVETMTDAVIMPESLSGRVTVRHCEGCLYSTLQLDANTQCNLAGRLVSVREMASYLRQTRAKPMTISYRLSDHIVTLISVLEQ